MNWYKDYTTLKGAIKKPSTLLEKPFWKQAADSRQRQRTLFDKIYTYGQGKYNNMQGDAWQLAGYKRKKGPYFSGGSRKRTKTTKKKVSKRKKTRGSKNPKKTLKNPKNVTDPPYNYGWNLTYKKAKSFHPITEGKQVSSYETNFGSSLRTTQGQQSSVSLNDDGSCVNLGTSLYTVYTELARFYNAATANFVRLENVGSANVNTFLLKDCTLTINLVNQSPSSTEVDLYYCLSKKTTEATSVDPANLWGVGLAAQQAGTTGTSSYPDTKPTDSKIFNQHWKIIKKITWKLDPGQEAQVNFKFKVNRYLDTNYLVQNNNIRGITICPMMTVRGIPGSIGATASYANTTTTTTPSKVAFTTNIKYTAVMCTVFPKITRQVNTLAIAAMTAGPAPTAASVWTISDAAGTTVDNNVLTTFA